MRTISKKRFMFKNTDGGVFITKGGMEMEEAPDWIGTTLLYKLAVEDGDLIIVSGSGTDKDAAVAVAKAVRRTRAAAK